MKPCPKNKRVIAWMAAGVLDATESETLRQHFESCPACRRHWQSMSELSEQLTNASDLPAAEPSESFHRTLVQKIAAQEQRSLLFDWVAVIQRLWPGPPLAKFAAGVALVLVLAVAALPWIHSSSRDEDRVPTGAQIVASTEPANRTVPRPTLASYHRAADISLETLDALLTRQAFQISPAGGTLTVSSLLTPSSEN